MKETFYFSHDYNAREDAKIQNMLSKIGWEGYGLYWVLIEKLAEANGKLMIDDLAGISFACRVDINKLVLLVSDFLLFEKDTKYFWSNRLLEHLKHREKLSNIRSKSGKKGGQANAKQMLSKCQANEKQNEAKQRKVKENKINTITNVIKDKPLESEITYKEEYGREDINNLLKEFETIMGFKSSSSKDRIFANHLIKNYTPEQLTAMINFCSKDGYIRVGSLEKLWFKRGDVIAGIKSDFNKKNNIVIAQ